MSEPTAGAGTIRTAETSLYRIPNEQTLEDATQSFDVLEIVSLTVESDEGHRGLGFTYTIGRGGAATKRFLDDELIPRLEGQPVAPRTVREALRGETTFIGREGISEFAIGAVDIAVWDLLGKRADLPLCELLGGTREPVPMYETDGGWLQYDADTLVENAREIANDGFAGMKMKVGSSIDRDVERVRTVRDALPADLDLMLDGNCSYTLPEARRFANRLDDVAMTWFEEPLPKGDYAAYADLRRHVDVPIAAGENLYNETQFRQLTEQNAVDYLQPDVCRVGGITPWMIVADLAATSGLAVSPHYIEPLHAHLACAADNVPYIEHHSTVLDELLADPVAVDDGRIRPPARPGHGMAFEDVERYRED
ncbi:mandelate racemase/muconate lactonizing enzyme family protein [Halalkalicoccus jeotgali]|uniref:Mandelate racemase or evolutionary related enzyme of the mandelate racemase muconate lactonizing enzyme family protein n=1 Tax=Halalkalicoccus jeotgali (strain DSM 18796 / CECT 7217 / JCM 14584 / KCTC 4019 / B3) TaxID=795797 RepID=D8J6I0_HALJB|nr:mandelate racemase/muconate lactonizing enzyme family protein [Halalkalicoccus jeotgali]ADJ13857.1 putative mandelate racemase or evolutionary related enzyme of the mandelate racemase muconate lactonizing enzyme family protein [Halalkalicoccus jeotgali B3]ELY34097.1 putative mandelate racemase [Halalkalicoccus jeotgali B3]